jgi:hypothetical protein
MRTLRRNPLAQATYTHVEGIAYIELAREQHRRMQETRAMVAKVSGRLSSSNPLVRLYWRLRYSDRAVSWWGIPK